MFNNLNIRQGRNLMGHYKIWLILTIVLGVALSIAACEMLGPKVKTETPPAQPTAAPAPPKLEAPATPSPSPAPAVSPRPEAKPPVTPSPAPSPAPAPAVSPRPEAKPPVALTPPPPEIQKEETKPAPLPAPAQIFVITLKNANVRTEADPKGKIITTLKKGTKVEKIGQTSNWVNVKLPSGETGYIFHELVKELE
ncbi:MAG: SH3 domain-containing protein [Deltaproteobacteria bacterium]|nr:SH3 domain-containing protein [Deltaproteobacteria bacterium]